MAKKITAQVKLQIPAGKATPAPPVGTALGPQGVNIMDFCKAFNAKTSGKDQEGLIIPVVITIFSDRSFTFITKTPPVPVLIKRAVSIAKGSAEPHKTKVGKITQEQVKEISKIKMPDLNCFDLEAAMRSVAGTARSMGVDVVWFFRGLTPASQFEKMESPLVCADVAELADAHGSGPCTRKGVEVQVLSSAPRSSTE